MIDTTQVFQKHYGRSVRCNQTRPSTAKSQRTENCCDCDGETAFHVDGLNVKIYQNEEVAPVAWELLRTGVSTSITLLSGK